MVRDYGHTVRDYGHTVRDYGHTVRDYGHTVKDYGHIVRDYGHTVRDLESERAMGTGLPYNLSRTGAASNSVINSAHPLLSSLAVEWECV